MGLQRKGLRAHSQQLDRPTENYNPMEKTNKHKFVISLTF